MFPWTPSTFQFPYLKKFIELLIFTVYRMGHFRELILVWFLCPILDNLVNHKKSTSVTADTTHGWFSYSTVSHSEPNFTALKINVLQQFVFVCWYRSNYWCAKRAENYEKPNHIIERPTEQGKSFKNWSLETITNLWNSLVFLNHVSTAKYYRSCSFAILRTSQLNQNTIHSRICAKMHLRQRFCSTQWGLSPNGTWTRPDSSGPHYKEPLSIYCECMVGKSERVQIFLGVDAPNT